MQRYMKHIYVDKEKRKERDEYNHLFKKLTAKLLSNYIKVLIPKKMINLTLCKCSKHCPRNCYGLPKKIEEGNIIQNEAWCTTVAKNKTIDFFRKKKPERISDYENSEDQDKGLKTLIR